MKLSAPLARKSSLQALLEEHGLRRGYDYGCANVVRCRPPENRRPTKTEIANCLPYLAEVISTANPKAVLAVGDTAARVFMGKPGLMENIDKLHYADQCPRRFLEQGSVLDMKWPDGRKWAGVGAEQVRRML